MREWLKNAFSVEDPDQLEPTERQKEIADKVCREVARRRMTTPALLFLETFRPLNFIGSQVLHFFQPIVSAVLTTDGYQQFAIFLESRGSVNYLCRRIEFYENEHANRSDKNSKSGNDTIEIQSKDEENGK